MIIENNTTISYTISKNINRNMSILVQNGEVIVKAPWYLKKDKINEIIEDKRKWILDKIKEYEDVMVRKNRAIKLLGTYYFLKTQYANICAPQINLKENEIEIILPNKYKKSNEKEILKKLISKMYKVIAEKEVELAMENARKKLGFAPENYEIKEMKKYLGKCTNDKIILINPEIAMFNKNVINYIVLHEFCHLKCKNHSKSYFELLSKYEPDYRKYEKDILEYHF